MASRVPNGSEQIIADGHSSDGLFNDGLDDALIHRWIPVAVGDKALSEGTQNR